MALVVALRRQPRQANTAATGPQGLWVESRLARFPPQSPPNLPPSLLLASSSSLRRAASVPEGGTPCEPAPGPLRSPPRRRFMFVSVSDDSPERAEVLLKSSCSF